MQRSSQNVTVDKPTPSFFTGRMFFSRPTNSVRALKGKAPHCSVLFISSRQTSSTCVVSSHALPMLTDCLICDVVSKQLRNLTSVWRTIPSLCLWTRSVHCLLFLDSVMSDWLQRFRIIVLKALKIAEKWSLNLQRLYCYSEMGRGCSCVDLNVFYMRSLNGFYICVSVFNGCSPGGPGLAGTSLHSGFYWN